ncbi:hypothetical protein CROQUDRAFT_84126 [Cronartium quercuum f. sp. fusiforme G11]|uniref:Inner centromere protein ARK-binding domain-containing protein n=1 Tax=Cronartium quercuum f. sp. fusiforme G11 TaxID=708437 RepID=A0A9P6NAT9_9BASI|nr:hypothetical protein CROQUDRAFT_84126 [Cronartium quercuum f. sp. fusiforme G11]
MASISTPLGPTISAIASTSTNPNLLPEDIRLKFSHYASEIRNQVDTLYDEQHKWLEDHLLGVQDTFAKIKRKKHGTRSVMADIIKTPSRKRIQASKKKQIQPELLRFQAPSLPNQQVPLSPVKLQLANEIELQLGSNNPSSHRTAAPQNALVSSKANFDLHSTASKCFTSSDKSQSNVSVLGELPNGRQPVVRGNTSTALNRGASSPNENHRAFEPTGLQTIGGAPFILKGLGLSSLTQVSQIHTQPNHSSINDTQFPTFAHPSYSLLAEEEAAALSKSYQSPVKKPQPSTSKIPPAASVLGQPTAIPPQPVAAAPLLDDVLVDANMPSGKEATIVVYQSAAEADSEAPETVDLTGEDTEPEVDDVAAGHELSAIQEGEEEDDQAVADPKTACQPASNQKQSKISTASIRATGQSAPISSSAIVEPRPSEIESREPFVTSNSTMHQPGVETLAEAVLLEREQLPESDRTPAVPSQGEVVQESQVARAPDADETVHQPHTTGSNVDADVSLQPNPVECLTNSVVVHRDPAHRLSESTLLSSHRSDHPETETVDLALVPHLPVESVQAIVAEDPVVSVMSHTAQVIHDEVLTSKKQAQTIQPLESLHISQPSASIFRPTKPTAAVERASTPEADDDPVVEVADSQPERARSSSAHHDTTAEVPLNDNPSHLRNTRALQSQAPDTHSRTPGPSTHNLFTPGNARAALIRSPQSQWSSKPTATGWLNKPNKTPGIVYGAGLGIGVGKSEAVKLQGPGGSPVGAHGSNYTRVSATLQSQASDYLKFQDGLSTQASTISDAQAYPSTHRRTSKRTSTEAGFPYTSETQESKIARPYAPLRFGQTATDKGKKGVDDLKNRLSKIQRESAMHERTQHNTTLADLFHPVQRTSLATSGSSVKPTNQQSSQPSTSASTKVPWAPSQAWETNAMAKSQSSRPVLPAPSSHRPPSPPPVSSLRTYAGVPLVDRDATSEAGEALQAAAKNAESTTSGIVKRSSVGDLVAVYEAKKVAGDPAAVTAGPTTTSPAPSITLTHETKSKSPVDIGMHVRPALELKSTAHLRSTTPDSTPPLLRFDNQVPTSVTQEEIIEGSGFHDEMILRDDEDESEGDDEEGEGAPVAVGQSEEDLIELSSKNFGLASPSNSGFYDAEVGAAPEEGSEEEDEGDEEAESRFNSSRHHDTQARDDDDEAQSEHSAQLSPSTSHFQDVNRQSSRPASNLSHTTPPPNQAAENKTPPTGGLMGVFKAGAALATSWTSSKNKPELKSLQLAAAAAKKEQEDKERKAIIKEEREQRRIAVVEKKQAEERERAEADRKARAAEADRKKKDREESSRTRSATVKAKPTPSATPGYHRDVSVAGEPAKKRKVEAETSRTIEPKKAKAHKPEPISVARIAPGSALKTSSNSSFQPSRVAPAAPPGSAKSVSKYHAAAASAVGVKSMADPNRTAHPTPSASKPSIQIQHSSKLPKPSVAGSSKQKLSTVAQSTKAPGPSASTSTKGKQKVTEEYVELPDIDSEYSDDDEEEHARKEAALPDWAQSMVMREALANQRKLNPNDIFGATIPAPAMDEIFRGRASRFRHRTSSANWTGTDQLTAMEEAEYAKRMGYHQNQNQKR